MNCAHRVHTYAYTDGLGSEDKTDEENSGMDEDLGATEDFVAQGENNTRYDQTKSSRVHVLTAWIATALLLDASAEVTRLRRAALHRPYSSKAFVAMRWRYGHVGRPELSGSYI